MIMPAKEFLKHIKHEPLLVEALEFVFPQIPLEEILLNLETANVTFAIHEGHNKKNLTLPTRFFLKVETKWDQEITFWNGNFAYKFGFDHEHADLAVKLCCGLLVYQWKYNLVKIYAEGKDWFNQEMALGCVNLIILNAVQEFYEKAYDLAREHGLEIDNLFDICDKAFNVAAKAVFLHLHNMNRVEELAMRL